MSPKRRRSKIVNDASGSSKTPCNTTAVDSFPETRQDIKISTGFEADDFQEWWSSSTDRSADSIIDPLLHFSGEIPQSQTTLQDIYPDSFLKDEVPVTAPKGRKKPALSALGVHKDSSASDKGISPREIHILSERQRRRGMNHLFSTLSSLLPETTSKSDKSTIISEIVIFIQSLQKELECLSKKRSEALHSKANTQYNESGSPSSTSNCTSTIVINDPSPSQEVPMNSTLAPNVTLSICGSDAFVTISSIKKENMFSKILLLFEQHNLQIMNANISTSEAMIFHCFHAKALDGNLDKARDVLQNALQQLACH